jgi:hypothetical protein
VLPSDHRSFRVLAGCAGAEAPEDAFVVLGSGRGRAEARFPSRLAALRAGAEVATRAQELVPGGLRIGALETAPPTTEAVLRLHPSWPLLFHVTVVRAAGARPVPPAVPARTAATLGTRADASALRRSRAFRAAAPVPDGSPVVAGGRLAGLARSGRCVLLSDVRFRARVALLRAGAGGRLAIAGLAEARGDGNRGDAAALRLDGARAAPGDFVVTAPSGLPAGLLLGRVTGEGPVLEPEPGGGACEALAREPQ